MNISHAIVIATERAALTADGPSREKLYFGDCTVLSAEVFLAWLEDPAKREVLRELVLGGNWPRPARE